MPLKVFLFLYGFGLLCIAQVDAQTLSLTVEGKTEKETEIIDSLYYQKNFKDYASLQTETVDIKKRLFKLGYIESDLFSLKKTSDTSYFATYHLNRQYKTIKIYFDTSINRNILKLVSTNIKDNYFETDFASLEKTLQLLNSEISNQGDPFSTLQLSNITKETENTLRAELVVTEQIQRTIDSIIIKGYEKFPKSFVKRYLKIKQKQPFNLKKIKEKMSDLENLQFASQIKDPEVLFTKDSTLLYIYLEKQKSNAFDGFLGFGTNTETNKIEFDGYLNLNLVNNLNYGESFRLLYKSDENAQKTFDVKAKLPYMFGSPIGMQLGLNIFKRDSTFLTVSQSAKIEYQINPRNEVSVGINSITSNNLLDVSVLFVDDYTSTFYTLNYLHTRRQRYDLLFPINFQFDMTTGFGNRNFENTKESQTLFDLNTYKIFNLNDRNSVFVRLNGAYLLSDNYFENELLRFGGINSIRGFEENSLSANLYTVINTEYRYRVSSGLYVHSVIDAAYFENQNIDLKSKLFGFGFGFGLLTKAGLFKFNYSSGKTENQPFRLSDSKIHISLTATF